MPLTQAEVKNAMPADKPYRLADERAMYLQVTPTGSKCWRLKYRFAGKERTLALGTFPEVSLAEARQLRDEARTLLRSGTDPNEAKRSREQAARVAATNSFEAVAREWIENNEQAWAVSTLETNIKRLEQDLFPWLGKRPIASIQAPDLLEVLRRVEKRGALETAHRLLSLGGRIFRYAIATHRATSDPTFKMCEALKPARGTHYATITDPQQIGPLIIAIEGYEGKFVTKCALRLAPLLFVRPGELRGARWSEFRLADAEWHVPDPRMKMRMKLIVPLSRQAMTILGELHPHTGSGEFLFPNPRARDRSMSNNTINAALRRLGYDKNQITGHGFRRMASTLLNEAGWNPDAVERQLAHVDGSVRGIYNAAEYMEERRRMMQAWANYLDSLAQNLLEQQFGASSLLSDAVLSPNRNPAQHAFSRKTQTN